MKCPVCEKEINSMFCPDCGFDRAKDFTLVPAFAVLHREDVEALQKRYTDARKTLEDSAAEAREEERRQAEVKRREEEKRQAEVKRQEEEKRQAEAKRQEEEKRQAEAKRREEAKRLEEQKTREQVQTAPKPQPQPKILDFSRVQVVEKIITYRQACEGCSVKVKTSEGKKNLFLGAYPDDNQYIPVMSTDKSKVLTGSEGKPLYIKLKLTMTDIKMVFKIVGIAYLLIMIAGIIMGVSLNAAPELEDTVIGVFTIASMGLFYGAIIIVIRNIVKQKAWKNQYQQNVRHYTMN